MIGFKVIILHAIVSVKSMQFRIKNYLCSRVVNICIDCYTFTSLSIYKILLQVENRNILIKPFSLLNTKK